MTTNPQIQCSEVHAVIDGLRSKYVKLPRDREFRTHLDRLIKRDDTGRQIAAPVVFTSTGETRGIALVDGAGGGKTSLVDHALREHPALQTTEAGRMPWLGVRVPSPATLKSLGLEILRQAGYPEARGLRHAWEIWTQVRYRLQLLGTVVLWIDEAHDLFRNGSAREIEDILKTLKSLMQGEGAVIVILTGIETLWQIASYDDQVKRRYSRIELPSVTMAGDEKILWKLIETFSAQAKLAAPEKNDLVARLIHAGRARFGRCIEQIINSIEVALHEGASSLEIEHFARSYDMQEGCAPGENIFRSPRWSQIDVDAPRRA
ncbi:TniB family NTP-binding protein [Paracoccus sp. MC1854]|uniref:TniB family NTP-binding protein n=1 Tax=Paracoccus sp. MC1854 TaxID=2760306 RepID=UPI00160090CF|nr:TniB family NTP-binding protein [Paracoccus sp. MC1854]